MDDFFFVYTVMGPKRIKYLLNSFKSFSDDINVLVVTNTPEMFNVSVNFNLHVVHIEDLRSDKNRMQEPLVCSTDEEIYDNKLAELIANGHPYPIGVLRHAVRWLLDHDITKFVLLDPGAKPYDTLDKPFNYIKIINVLRGIKDYTNIIFINPFGIDESSSLKNTAEIRFEVSDMIASCDIDLNQSTKGVYRLSLLDPSLDVPVYNTCVFSEGWLYGFWFNNKEHLKLHYFIWNFVQERALENNRLNAYTQGHMREVEPVADFVNGIFNQHFDTLIAAHSDIVSHKYTHRW